MENESMRKKSISLFLIIFIVLLVAILIILLVKIFKDNSSEEEIANTTENASAQLSVTANTSNYTEIEDISESNEISDSNTVNVNDNSSEISNTSSDNENNTVADNTTSSEENILTLNNHTFKFDNSTEASIVQDSGKSVIQAIYTSSYYKLLLNPDTSSSFDDLKNNSDLKTYLESNYNLSITSTLKSGTLVNLDVIIFTISNGSNTAYCVITPLNDSEVLYAQIYNTTDMTTLVDNSTLAESLDEISNIIAESQD